MAEANTQEYVTPAEQGLNDPVSEESLKLYPERRGDTYEPTLFERVFLGNRGAKVHKYKCEKVIMDVIETSPLVKLMLSAIKSAGW